MSHYRITGEARADLDAIWLYVAERGGIETADRMIDAIIKRFPLLASTPSIGFG
jgi:plasmid stabilization system protein ParE